MKNVGSCMNKYMIDIHASSFISHVIRIWFYKLNTLQQKLNHKIDKNKAVIQLSHHQVRWKIG